MRSCVVLMSRIWDNQPRYDLWSSIQAREPKFERCHGRFGLCSARRCLELRVKDTSGQYRVSRETPLSAIDLARRRLKGMQRETS